MSRQKSIVALLALLLGLNLTPYGKAQELRKERNHWVGEIHKTFKVQQGGTLVIDEVRGDVTIRTWEKNEVDIHELKKMDVWTEGEAKKTMDETKTGYVQQGNTVRIGGLAFDREWIRSQFDIIVPETFNCEIETKGGDLSVIGVKGSIDASTGGGDITLQEIDGPVDTKTGGGDIEIKQTTQRVTANTGGGDVDITDSGGLVRVSTGGGDVTVIRTREQVHVRTGGGDVEIQETQGDVEITTGGGEIQIVDASGDVNVQTGGGEIDIRNVAGNFRAVTGGGSIRSRTVKGQLDVTTGGGDIELEDIQGTVEVSTGGGDVSAEITLKDFTVNHRVKISTGGGEIELTIPEKLPATIEAEIKFRRRSWEDYKITSDFPLTITTNDEDDYRYRIIRATGDINGGGDTIRLETGGGNIHILKRR